MNPKVSVIVPVYGAEAFLPTCISSLRAQTLRDIELIFVCDGSPDHSLAILRRVESLDSRIRVIAFEENQGVSAARNAGLDAARGDYIGFCDGDDWAEPQMYETLLRAARQWRAVWRKPGRTSPSAGCLRTGARRGRMCRWALTTARCSAARISAGR